MNNLSDFFYRKTNGFSCLALTVIMVLYASLVLGGQSACFEDQLPDGFKVLGLKTGYSYDYVKALFGSMDQASLLCYQNLVLVWDNIFPVLYGMMYVFWLSLIFKNTSVRQSKFRYLNLYPFVPVILDWTENFFEWRLTENYIRLETITESQVQVASMASQVKWGGSWVNYLIILVGIILLIINLYKQRSHINSSS